MAAIKKLELIRERAKIKELKLLIKKLQLWVAIEEGAREQVERKIKEIIKDLEK